MNVYDVIVIGGGVVGTAVLRSLAAYKAKVLLLEKSSDVACGSSRANSGIVHAGYDAESGTKKAYFNVKGAAMFPSLTAELDVPYQKVGSLVAARKEGLSALEVLRDRGVRNGVKVEILGRDAVRALEPNIADDIEYALYAPEAGVVSPYQLTIAFADHAVTNGAEVRLEEKVIALSKEGALFSVRTEKEVYAARFVVNAAGAGAAEVNALIGEEPYQETHAVGDYYILDHKEAGVVRTVVFPLPDERGKGILVAPTADGNVILGPTSRKVPHEEAERNAVTAEGLLAVREGAARLMKGVNVRSAIRVYAGTRTAVGGDFIIEESAKVPGFYMLLGICSPGLTSAPAIGEYVAEEAAKKLSLEKKEKMIPLPKAFRFRESSAEEIAAKAKEDPAFGRIVCRCEKVTEGEIVRAVHSPVPAKTVDAVKRRVRAGMGRCQGGFCQPRVMEILSRELGIPMTAVRKGDAGSEIAPYEVKDGYETL
ncbi:MAG: NAD(P)/FAD-dependent oxidoreductase [Clostridia bacterium]|nr:NAD(P)/FAD-dependent oxidoreductase [Clostridia bacterium]